MEDEKPHWADGVIARASVRVSPKLRQAQDGYIHYCPGCELAHRLPDGWAFNGNVAEPTFTPSFKHSCGSGRVCHYHLTAGVMDFCTDSTHALAGKKVPLPDLPEHMRE